MVALTFKTTIHVDLGKNFYVNEVESALEELIQDYLKGNARRKDFIRKFHGYECGVDLVGIEEDRLNPDDSGVDTIIDPNDKYEGCKPSRKH